MKDRTKKLLKTLKVTQAEFAVKIGMTPQGFSNAIAGRQEISGKALRKAREIYSVNLDWWLSGVGEMFISQDEIQSNIQLQEDFALLHRLRETPKRAHLVEILSKIPDSKIDQVEGILKTFIEK
ncbi:DNA-binding helix-turn-helix protein [Leptospira interrogans str. 2003000735]|uniref:DNA-binding helix-turn-helix protein n=2 Tax=Leptospira interrogans TaxID=173 RepID=A0A829D3I4_LEPIR|nr:helix-turn-helix transcriptional regulator [Leptospira interrogans]EMY06274.1 DNA-binding helix-turn-helix protein [Leptospira interrogans str. 2002000626]EMY25599.1 DNA-binding helix-turn-helix protein [Leptospira interrogans serovar Australis str. 200703203]EKN89889.1 DNA-binding helix-turn-helix protein [Leptospira interrogans str. 2002000624]EKQ40351.1 DNA-binding helix-turn-helix protein [Leptospira interrogans str. 2002000621]EKQ46164.1 DNA-binding helix-turn-helix protein [Leptospira